MRTLNAWNMLHLLRSKTVSNTTTTRGARQSFAAAGLCSLLVLCFLLLQTTAATAQFNQGSNINYQDFQGKNYYFGITLGYNQSDFRIYQSKNFVLNDSFARAESVTGPGFNLGIVSSLNMTPNLSLRFLPSLSFQDRQLKYSFRKSDGKTTVFLKPVESTYLEFPLLLKLRSDRINNFAVYLLAGGKYSMDMASQKDVNQKYMDQLLAAGAQVLWSDPAGEDPDPAD